MGSSVHTYIELIPRYHNSALLKSDVERIALQKELQAKNKEIGNLQSTLKQVQGELYKADAASKRVALDAEELATSLKEVGDHCAAPFLPRF